MKVWDADELKTTEVPEEDFVSLTFKCCGCKDTICKANVKNNVDIRTLKFYCWKCQSNTITWHDSKNRLRQERDDNFKTMQTLNTKGVK